MTTQKQKIVDTLAIYGANTALWPEDIAKTLESVLTEHPDLQDMIETQSEMDALLNSYTIDTSRLDILQNTILQNAATTAQDQAKQTQHIQKPHRQHAEKPAFLKTLWTQIFGDFSPASALAPGGGMAVAALLGFWLSFNGIVTPPNQSQDTLLLDASFYTEMAVDDIDSTLILYPTPTTQGASE